MHMRTVALCISGTVCKYSEYSVLSNSIGTYYSTKYEYSVQVLYCTRARNGYKYCIIELYDGYNANQQSTHTIPGSLASTCTPVVVLVHRIQNWKTIPFHAQKIVSYFMRFLNYVAVRR